MSDRRSPEVIWEAALGELQLQMTKATFETWVKHTQVIGCDAGTYIIGVQNGLACDWLENRLKRTIEETLSGLTGAPTEVRFQATPKAPRPRRTITEAELEQQELEIDGVRVRTYNEIVEPDVVFCGTQYFRKKWLPLLGCTAWLLILELRQRCYYARREKDPEERKRKSRDRCKVTLAELGAAIGVSESTARRALCPLDTLGKDAKPEAAEAATAKQALIDLFILERKVVRRYSTRRGREVNETTLWRVRLDEPLTPEDRKRFSTCQNDS